MEVYDTVQEAVIKTTPKKEMNLGKMVVWGGLTRAEKRREVKGKGEKERYSHLNAEFQRIARSDKKVFLSDECKDIEERNRMGKIWDLFEKISNTKGTFHAKMGTKRTEMVWTQQKQRILRRGDKNTQKNYTKKIFMTQITTMVWSLT